LFSQVFEGRAGVGEKATGGFLTSRFGQVNEMLDQVSPCGCALIDAGHQDA